MSTLDIKSFRSAFLGKVFEPADAGYSNARQIWNASVNKQPRVIAQCFGVADVVAAVEFGRDHNLLTAIRGGGHNVGGRALCDDGLVIDLSQMRSVFVDDATRRVRVQGGATLGDIDRETHLFGLAVPCGIVPKTGIGGLTLGGGVGWLIRKYGMTIDNLLSAQIVLANGKVMTASASDNDDLFWAAEPRRSNHQHQRCRVDDPQRLHCGVRAGRTARKGLRPEAQRIRQALQCDTATGCTSFSIRFAAIPRHTPPKNLGENVRNHRSSAPN